MIGPSPFILPSLRGAARDRRGVAGILLGVSGAAVIATAALATDVGLALAGRAALQANTDAAALAGAYTWSASGGTASGAESTATAWHGSHAVPNVTVTGTTATTSCVTAIAGLPNCTANAPNVITVTQTGTVATHFARLVGINSFTVSATAAASRSGGASAPLNVMFILDSTGSMGQADDTGCVVPGVSSPTKHQCAMYGVQTVMKQLLPSQDKVGLMVFPGLSTTFVPCGSYPSPVPYMSTGIAYQIDSNTLDTTYNNGSGTLVDTSPMVMAVGDNATSLKGCAKNTGGEGTYYAQAIQEAQATLQSEGAAGAQNVIIFLSDGAANANSQEHEFDLLEQSRPIARSSAIRAWCRPRTRPPREPGSIRSPTIPRPRPIRRTARPSTASPIPYTPCTAMQAIASDPTKFFSTSSACQLSTSPNSYADVATAFQQVAATLNKPRLVMP